MNTTAPATGFDTAAHPRDDNNGRFVETQRADPGNDLLCGGEQRFDWIDDEHLLQETARLAGFVVGRKMSAQQCVDLTVEDVQSELLVTMMSRRRRQIDGEVSSDDPTVIPEDSSERAWAYSVAQSIAARLKTRVKNSADWGAMAEFSSREWQMTRELGRSLTERERDALADEIRMARPPRRRPSTDFHRIDARFTTSLDASLTSDEGEEFGSMGRVLAAGDDTEAEAMFAYEHANDPTAQEFEAGSYGDQALQLLAGGARRNHGPSKMAYLALAERRGAPMPSELSLREDQATKVKRVVNEAGGPSAIARRVVEGHASKAETAALMAAFPEAEHRRAEEFAEVLLEFPDFADDVWAGTIAFATIRNPRARLARNTQDAREGAVA